MRGLVRGRDFNGGPQEVGHRYGDTATLLLSLCSHGALVGKTTYVYPYVLNVNARVYVTSRNVSASPIIP